MRLVDGSVGPHTARERASRLRIRWGSSATMDLPETQYAVTPDGLHIGYQVFGSGPYDLAFIDVLSNVDSASTLG